MFSRYTPTKVNYNIQLLVADYIDYIKCNQYFNTLPKWKKLLMNAGNSDKPITLPSIDATNSIALLPSISKKRLRSNSIKQNCV